jgi:hypothetical protein
MAEIATRKLKTANKARRFAMPFSGLSATSPALGPFLGTCPFAMPGTEKGPLADFEVHRLAALHRQRGYATHLIAIRYAAIIRTICWPSARSHG